MAEKEPGAVFYSPPEVIPGLLQWDYSSAIKTPRAPPFIAPSVAAAHRTPQDGRPSGIPPDLPLCLCSSHCHPARQCKKKAHFFGRFCGVRNASLRRTFCCVVHQKRDFKAHPAASTALLVGSFQLAADSRLSTHSSSTLDLGSLSTLETRDPATACVDSEASSSTVALGKAFSMVATTQPHASSFVIHPLHRLWFYDPERAIRTSLRARPELRARATPRGRVNPRVRLTNWLLAATPGQRMDCGSCDGRFAYTQKCFIEASPQEVIANSKLLHHPSNY